MKVIQRQDPKGLGQGSDRGRGEKWSHSRYILKTEPTGFAEWNERKEEVKDECQLVTRAPGTPWLS